MAGVRVQQGSPLLFALPYEPLISGESVVSRVSGRVAKRGGQLVLHMLQAKWRPSCLKISLFLYFLLKPALTLNLLRDP